MVGIDCSATMIERARGCYAYIPNLTFEIQDVLNLDLPPASFAAHFPF